MRDPIPVSIVVYFPDREIRLKAVLDGLNLNALTYGVSNGTVVPTGTIPIGAAFTLQGRVSDWREGKDGRPVLVPAPAPVVSERPARSDRAERRAKRAARRARSRARRSVAPQVHGDSAA